MITQKQKREKIKEGKGGEEKRKGKEEMRKGRERRKRK